ncbi:MAG: UDP-N-acetylglucosamine 2-epimerase (non-hydrolyzing) [Candidatus Riflebacteria bacterium]|nr:UDP-N-acetylglucosamine 2-epimerase (non-hydrolyzing) [Candidatus Riflebacteria bacterium]
MKILTIVGARPQFVKAAVVSRVIREHNANNFEGSSILEVIIHTGQHYDENMSGIFFDELDIPKPDFNLGVGSGSHGAQTGEMLTGIEKILLSEKPDSVLVYGDTNSTLAGALAASKLHIPIAHVEAGLRSFNREMPEEINRVLTDHISSWLFCPTATAVINLSNEGIKGAKKVFNSGDVMFDAALFYSQKALQKSNPVFKKNLPSEYILATIHRPASTDDIVKLTSLLETLEESGRRFFPVFWPIHPRTRNIIENDATLSKRFLSGNNKFIFLSEPLGYLDMVLAEKNSRLILTDSGGVQKEAYFHEKPCITMRTETEWVELVEAGWNFVAGLEKESILNLLEKVLNDSWIQKPHPSLYGNGKAGHEIIKILLGNDKREQNI